MAGIFSSPFIMDCCETVLGSRIPASSRAGVLELFAIFLYARYAAQFAAADMFIASIVFGLTRAIQKRIAGFLRIHSFHAMRCFAVSFLESRSGNGGFSFVSFLAFRAKEDDNATHATTTGPASGPRPTSSMPIIIRRL